MSVSLSTPLETTHLSKRYGRGTWALQDCTLALPAGRVAALVGPNGAGKTTLLHLSAGLLEPTAGNVRVFGLSPLEQPKATLPRLGLLAQDHPLYLGFSVADLLTLGRKLNPRWDDALGRARMHKLGIPLNRPAGKLSGGQQAQVALVLALAKRPELLLLDEPLASLDPLARREFLRTLMDAVAESGMTVLLSSHIIGDLERVCDHLIILAASHVQLMGDIQEIVRTHKRLIGPRQDASAVASVHTIIEASHTDRQTTLLVRVNGHLFDPSWEVQDVSLEDIVLGYLSLGQQVTGSMQAPPATPSTREPQRQDQGQQGMEVVQ
ncbi:MAG TPA: ABC transporter ATP-binding protein [Ktedonobacterales bacterium]|nr:ABC transporter ATP-binding protein [Ktedonobacterales bacterium]